MANWVSVTRTAQFNAAHRLHVTGWSGEQNRDFFGLCNNPNYHGHNYELHVTVSGPLDPVSGYLLDMKTLKDWIAEDVEHAFDHKNLNLDTEEFKNLNPTAENMAVVIWEKLKKRLQPEMKLKIKLFETPRNFVEFDGTQS
jgi:6-pyruvoyltetrahydropterin/6-carboxytetrahydropterin synthase